MTNSKATIFKNLIYGVVAGALNFLYLSRGRLKQLLKGDVEPARRPFEKRQRKEEENDPKDNAVDEAQPFGDAIQLGSDFLFGFGLLIHAVGSDKRCPLPRHVYVILPFNLQLAPAARDGRPDPFQREEDPSKSAANAENPAKHAQSKYH